MKYEMQTRKYFVKFIQLIRQYDVILKISLSWQLSPNCVKPIVKPETKIIRIPRHQISRALYSDSKSISGLVSFAKVNNMGFSLASKSNDNICN